MLQMNFEVLDILDNLTFNYYQNNASKITKWPKRT